MYLTIQIKAFKAGKRKNSEMNLVACFASLSVPANRPGAFGESREAS